MKRNTLDTINFIYYTANFPGSIFDTIRAIWPGHLGEHFVSKLEGIIEKRQWGNKQCIYSEDLINFLFALSDDNKALFLDWVNANYHYSIEHEESVKPVSYILVYTLNDTRQNNRKFDHYEVFCDEPDNKEAATKRLAEVQKESEGHPVELYCWNICPTEVTSEHYRTIGKV